MSNPVRRASDPVARRLSLYLRGLEELARDDQVTTSSSELSRLCGITAAQLRKDLSQFGSFGKRGMGYPVLELIPNIKEILGLTRRWRVALVGAGRIGLALAEYRGIRDRGFEIVGIVDSDPDKVGQTWGSIPIRNETELESLIEAESVDLLILAVPANVAQRLAERAVRAGIKGILNFAPLRLHVPSSVPVNAVNLGFELEALAFVLADPPEAP